MPGPFILMYHSIKVGSPDPYSVPPDAFRRQLEALLEEGFEIVPLSSFLPLLQAGQVGALRKKAVLTFDDGYRDFAETALPILLEYRAPATVFLVTGMLGKSASWSRCSTGERLMSEREAHLVRASGFTLGSHTATHADLTSLGPHELKWQLHDSREVLTSLGEGFHAFSYPWGAWSPAAAQAVRDAGYRCALAVGESTACSAGNLYCLPRITMRRDLELERFRKLLARGALEAGVRRGCRRLRAALALVAGNLRPE